MPDAPGPPPARLVALLQKPVEWPVARHARLAVSLLPQSLFVLVDLSLQIIFKVELVVEEVEICGFSTMSPTSSSATSSADSRAMNAASIIPSV